MYTARTYIGHHSRQIGSYLLLDVKVPLHDVVSFGVRLDKGGPQFVSGEGKIRVSAKVVKRLRARILLGAYCGGITDRGVLEEWSCQRGQQCELIWQRQHIKQSDTSPDCGSAVAQWVPGKADTRLEILESWIIEKGISEVWGGVSEIPQVRQLVGAFGQHGIHFVPQAHI